MASRPKSPRYKISHDREIEESSKRSPRKVSPREKVLVKRLKELFDELINSEQLNDIRTNDRDDISNKSLNYLQKILNSAGPNNDWEKGAYSMFTAIMLKNKNAKYDYLKDENERHLLLWMDFMTILQFLEIGDKVYICKNNGEKFNYIISTRDDDISAETVSSFELESLKKQLERLTVQMTEMKKAQNDLDTPRFDFNFLSQEQEADI